MQTLPSSLRHPRLAASGGRRRPLIGLTPLIDVVFILLVFFMLASSYLDWRSIVLSPPAKAAQGGGMEGALLVEVQAGGQLRLSGQPVRLQELDQRVRQRLAEKPGQRLVVKPDESVDLQAVVAVLDSLALAGAPSISLMR